MTDLAQREAIKPEIVSGPDPDAEWDAPCPFCHESWDAGPEAAAWGRQHCWRCGYTPSQGVAVPNAPAQPDWSRLVNDAVLNAMRSEPQLLAEAMTAHLGTEGMAQLARSEQERVGFTPGSSSGTGTVS